MRPFVLRLVCMSFAAIVMAGCEKSPKTAGDTNSNAAPPAPGPAVELLFTYGSEKESWINAVTADFHARNFKTASGKYIRVKTVAKGSGECMDDIISGTTQAHLTSPASAAFIKLANAQWRTKTGKDLVASTDNLVLSPVVIGMWQPMAEALGWGHQKIGWSDILALSQDPKGWAAHGNAQWGRFKFGHTHPLYSNSGLISILAEVYAASGKLGGLTPADAARPEVARYVSGIEQSVVHYGSSTGFFSRKMFANGPAYLSAAVMYENMVIESRAQQNLAFPIVAIYPKEGTFWSDHPVGIVEREWVTPEQREAAKQYIAFLLERHQQERAMEFGFRPALADVPLAAPFDTAHGVDPREPQTTLEVPSADTMDAIVRLWQENKKHANLTLVIDVSGSMNDQQRLVNARAGAQEMLKVLDSADYFQLMPFNNTIFPTSPAAQLKGTRDQQIRAVGSLIANGGTALYDAIATAYREQTKNAEQNADKISAIVVLTDGDDTDSKMSLDNLLALVRSDSEKKSIRIFTIGYGSDARKDVLQKIADATNAKFYVGAPENIREVFKDISTFF